MKKYLTKISLLAIVFALLSISVSAASVTYNWTSKESSVTVGGKNYNCFYPKEGTLLVIHDPDSAKTRIDFNYSSATVKNVLNYANSNKWYTGMDIKDNGNCFSAVTITTSLPNPKTDIESNAMHDYQNESEVVALGSIAANTNYYMSTVWHDYRLATGSAMTGNWYVNSELSHQNIPGIGDYNAVAYYTSLYKSYGNVQGKP